MIEEIRFILSEYDDDFEELLHKKLQPFVENKERFEENGDAGTTITIVFTIIQTVLSIPGFYTAMREIIFYAKQQKEEKNTEKDPPAEYECSWSFMINGDKYDLGGLPTIEERYEVLDRILEKYKRG